MKHIISFICNQFDVMADIHPATSLLDYIRKHLHLTGTKEGCREGDCGACTILVGEAVNGRVIYRNINSCLMPIGDIQGKHVVTIEGLNLEKPNSIQQAFIDEVATQCGFCTPGFIISLTGYFISAENINLDDAINYAAGNICRCTGHTTIKKAIDKAITLFNEKMVQHTDRISFLIEKGYIPSYFISIYERLTRLRSKDTSIDEKMISDSVSGYLISGGTDLFVQKWEDLLQKEVHLISHQHSANNIQLDGERCLVSAQTTISEIENSNIIRKNFSKLENYLKLFGSLPIRNRATVGGNIINASPIADFVNILLVLDSILFLKNNSVERQIKLQDFYLSYKTLNKQKDELLDRVSFVLPRQNSFFNYEKISRRAYLDIASVNSSIYFEHEKNIITKIHISAGGVAPVPKLLDETSEYLIGKEINVDNIIESINLMLLEISPISDARGSKKYKQLLLRQLILAHFLKFKPDLEFFSVKEIFGESARVL